MVFVVCFFFLREKMAQAYDFALDKIGMEIMSYQVCFFFKTHLISTFITSTINTLVSLYFFLT